MEAARLRPLRVGEMVDAAIKVYRARFAPLILIMVVLLTPVQALNALLQLSVSEDDVFVTDEFGGFDFDPRIIIGYAAGAIVVAFLQYTAVSLATGAGLQVVSDAYLGGQRGWRESVRFAVRRIRPLLWVVSLYSAIWVVGVWLCVVPGVYFYVAFSVAVPVLLLEDVRGAKALHRSRRLVENHWFRVAGVLGATWLLTRVVAFALGGALAASGLFVESELAVVAAQNAAELVALILVTPFSAAVTAVIYFDLRVRKEGYDLHLLAQTVGEPPPPPEPPTFGFPQPWQPQQPPPPPPTPPGWPAGSGSV